MKFKLLQLSASASAAAASIVAFVLYTGHEPSGLTASQPSNSQSASVLPSSVAPNTATLQAAASPASAHAAASSEPNSNSGGRIEFKVDADGKIVTDEDARLDLEKLYALYNDTERAKKLQQLEDTLPPSASQHLTELLQQYIHYQAAVYQTIPPGRELASDADALIEMDTLHGLRVQYFGAKTADGFFGEDEKVQHELLQLMSLEKDPSLTLEEKADRAQALYKTLHAMNAAAERGQRQAQAAEKSPAQ